MSMFNDIDSDKKGNEDSCKINSRKIKMYASRFIDRHWGFVGPGEKSKWYQGYAVNCVQMDTPCFTNCGGIREFWKPGIQRGKSAGSRNIDNEKWSKHYPPQWSFTTSVFFS